MRPRKRVYLYCADYDRRNDLAFVLRVRCEWARVEKFSEIADLYEAIKEEPDFGCIVLVGAEAGDRRADGLPNAGERTELAERVDFEWILREPEVAARAVEVMRSQVDPHRLSFAGRFVPAGDMALLVECMKMAASRKRGPKSQSNADTAAAVA